MTPVALANFTAPNFDYVKLAPLLIVFTGAIIGVLIEAFVARENRRLAQVPVSLVTLALAFAAVLNNYTADRSGIEAAKSYTLDGATTMLQGIILVVAFLGALLFAENKVDPAGDAFAPRASALPGSEDEQNFTEHGWLQTEVWPLFLFSVGGMLLFPAANDLLTMFVALEVLSLPLYLMAGMARRRRLLSQEAALKYFILGSFASAFFLYGSALVYGFSGSTHFGDIAGALTKMSNNQGMLTIGVLFIAVGLMFKIGVAPFHQWSPDVYQGAPTPLTGFMAAGTKIAAFGALMRVMYVAFGGARWDWQPVIWIIAIVSMLVGTIVGVAQSDIKRMLAFSSVAHAGFLMLAVAAASKQALSGSLFYMATYGITTLGAFAVVSLVRDATGEASHLGAWAGLGKKSPLTAGIFSLFLLALAGIPLTSGFTSKFAVFSAAGAAGATPLVLVAVMASAIAGFFYMRVIVLMFFTEPSEATASVVIPSAYTKIVVGVAAALTVLLGVLPQPLLDIADNAATFLR
jgi:NADH-quinone oxidoreductase subunit N